MVEDLEKSIVRSLVYSDIFDYPLTKGELWKFLIGKKIDKKAFEKLLDNKLPKKVICKNKFYCLKGREKIIDIRLLRNKESENKIKTAKKVIKALSRIPIIQLIGVSGGLALKNSAKQDDIDIFIITSKGSLWITRLITVIILVLIGQYRSRGSLSVANKICLNMLIDESSLQFVKSRQNLYTAHEIVQLLPVFGRNNMHYKFINANKWILKFLPNGIDIKILGYKNIKEKLPNILASRFLKIFENIAKHIQILYMRAYRTKETISDNMLALHPFEYRDYILREYDKRLKTYIAETLPKKVS